MDATGEKTSLKKDQFLEHLIYKALNGGFPIAVWKKPKQNLVEIIIDNLPGNEKVSQDLDHLPPGFMMHPFKISDGHPPVYIKATTYFRFNLDMEEVELEDHPWLTGRPTSPEEIKNKIYHKITETQVKINENASTKKEFLDMVSLALDEIKSGNIFKVVPAKLKKMTLSPDFDIVRTFIQLCENYPNAFVNLIHSPKTGFWIGASPETLIKTKGNMFYTMSLAGTQKAKGDNPLKNAAWTQKEIEEQAMVSRYIVNCFKKIRLREYDEIGPKTTLAGSLLHLKSEFLVDMKATNFPQLGTVMLELLHPTSAICGMPKDNALAFIEQHEKFNRSYFAGFLGPVNVNRETNIFVNLRCARLAEGKAWLYAGAGITEDSDPIKEWGETELKCNTIGKFIHPKPKT